MKYHWLAKVLIIVFFLFANCQRNKSTIEPDNYNSDYDIVFSRGYDIFIMKNADSTQIVRLTDEKNYFDPKWSPDGDHIAFYGSSRHGKALFIMNLRDKKINLLTELGSFVLVDFAWSPSGDKIAFTHSFEHEPRYVYTINVDGSGLKRLSSGKFDFWIKWSPNGSQISFGKDYFDTTRGYIVNVDGSDEHQFVDAFLSGDMSWSPDTQQIVFFASFDSNVVVVNDIANSDIYLADINGQILQRLTNSTKNGLSGHMFIWELSGKKIFFCGAKDPGFDNRNIYSIDLTNNEIKQLTIIGRINSYLISPDGKQILFQRVRDNARSPDIFDFYLVNSNGSNLRKILSRAHGSDWCPVIK